MSDTVKKKAPTFTKKQLANSRRFARRKDLVNALLEDDKRYTIAETNAIIYNYLKKEVN